MTTNDRRCRKNLRSCPKGEKNSLRQCFTNDTRHILFTSRIQDRTVESKLARQDIQCRCVAATTLKNERNPNPQTRGSKLVERTKEFLYSACEAHVLGQTGGTCRNQFTDTRLCILMAVLTARNHARNSNLCHYFANQNFPPRSR